MTGPKRLVDGNLSGLGKTCLRSADHDDPSPEAQDRMLLALGVSAAVTTTAAAAQASVSSSIGHAFRSMGLLKWFGAGALGGGLALGTASQVHRILPSDQAPSASQTVSLGNAPSRLAPVPTVSLPSSTVAEPVQEPGRSTPASETWSMTPPFMVTPSPIREPVGEPSPETLPSSSLPSQPVVVVASAPSVLAPLPAKSALVAEVSALDRVRVAMAGGNWGGALRQLDEYQKAFPSGHLGQEAAVLRIEAWLRAGNSGMAKQLADQFLVMHPNSPLADRVRVLMGQMGGGRRRSIP